MNRITEFLFTSALKCVSAYASESVKEDGKVTIPSVIFGLADAVTGNLISEKVKAHLVFKNLQKNLGKGDPENINHDLKKVFIETAGITFGFIAKDYSRRLEQNAREEIGFTDSSTKHELKNLQDFVKENQNSITDKISAYPFIESDILTPSLLLSRIFNTMLESNGQTLQKFNLYFESHFTIYFDLIFCELLKHNDMAFKGFQIWILKTLLINSNEANENFKEIKLALSSLQAGHSILPLEQIQTILDSQQIYFEKIENKLDAGFNESASLIRELSEKIERNFQTDKIVKNLENKIHLLNLELEENKKYIQQLEIKQAANAANPDFQLNNEHESYLLKKIKLEKEKHEAQKEFDMISYFNMAIFACNTLHIEKKYKKEIDELIKTLTRFKDYLDAFEKIKNHEFYFQMVINLKNAYLMNGDQDKVLGIMKNAYEFSKHIFINYKEQRQYVIFCEHFYSSSKEVLVSSFFFNKKKNTNKVKDIYLDILKTTKDNPIEDKIEKSYFDTFLSNMNTLL
jgi:hypothetical protein